MEDVSSTEYCNCYPNGNGSRQVDPVPGIGSADLTYFIGLSLAIGSSLFIGSSFIVKKRSLIRLAQRNGQRAGEGGFGYLSDWLWWAGFLSMALGEGLNFAAYAFVPASLVTPLGALSVLVTAILASYFLDEKLSLLAKLSCTLCLLGSTMTVLHAPSEGSVQTLEELADYLSQPAFVTYLLLVISISTVMIFYCAPTYGSKNIFVYIIICSLVGSLSVMAVKGLGIALVNTITGKSNDFSNGLTYVCIANLIVSVSIQMNYLNKALDTYNTSVVSPIYYVFFTVFVMLASAILYGEFSNMTWFNLLGLFSGFFTIIIAVFMLHLFKDLEISLTDVRYVLGPQLRGINYQDNEFAENEVAKSGKKSSLKKWDSRLDFDRGFNSVFVKEESDKLLPPEAAAALAKEKWRMKKSRHVSFYGSVSDTGV